LGQERGGDSWGGGERREGGGGPPRVEDGRRVLDFDETEPGRRRRVGEGAITYAEEISDYFLFKKLS